MTADLSEVLEDEDGSWYVIDQQEFEEYVDTLAALILVGGSEIHDHAIYEWTKFIYPESARYAFIVASKTASAVADRIEAAPVFEHRHIARRLELFSEAVHARLN